MTPLRPLARRARPAILLAAALLQGCASASLPGPDVPDASERRRDWLGASEIGPAEGLSALEAIRLRRPEFARADLRARAAGAGGSLVVYVDGAPWGALESLGGLPAHLVADVRRVRPAEARLRYGPTVSGTVLEVRTLRSTHPRAGAP